ncbi:hypothetical protein [Streptomyces marianii]|uniref:hypothetical protein n=1 Tax=Streptomyces marianii TaxID=1817406 RepID=UPI001F1767BB|nr:hypothetical protein [Streptomyces marianii]
MADLAAESDGVRRAGLAPAPAVPGARTGGPQHQRPGPEEQYRQGLFADRPAVDADRRTYLPYPMESDDR